MNTISRISTDLSKDIFVLEDELNPEQSNFERIFPTTSIDQVFDFLEPEPISLRDYLERFKNDILTDGLGAFDFPVKSVNGLTGDIELTKEMLGLGRVDNTGDYAKPLSIPQRQEIMSILANYNFRTNLTPLYDHLNDSNNPHHVTLEQLDSSEELTRFVNNLIDRHNSDRVRSHSDIRNNITTLWDYYDYLNRSIDVRINRSIEVSTSHLTDPEAHKELITPKEDKINKVGEIGSNYNYTQYPSTRAVVEFVNAKITEFNQNLNLDLPTISDIRVIPVRTDLPIPGANFKKIVYIIKQNDLNAFSEIAVCRLVNDSWQWDIKQIGAISKLDSRYFSILESGVTLNLGAIYNDMLVQSDNGFLLSGVLASYYSRTEMDNRYLRDLEIVPGVDYGTLRYFKNGNEETSRVVSVKGLNDLAFLDKVTEQYIEPESVNESHLIPGSVAKKHLKSKSVDYKKIECSSMKVLGNIRTDRTDGQEISLVELADLLRPLIGGWPDPNNPSNPWNYYFNDMKVSPHLWDPGVEINLADESFGMRFTGTISCIPNYQYLRTLSERINLDSADLVDAGGTWVFESDPKRKTILGGSNITGHTFGTVNIDEDGLYFESISIGDRVDAEYDIWVRYTKTGVVTEGPDYVFDFNDYGWEDSSYLFEYSSMDTIDPLPELPVTEVFSTNETIYFAENSFLNVSI